MSLILQLRADMDFVLGEIKDLPDFHNYEEK